MLGPQTNDVLDTFHERYPLVQLSPFVAEMFVNNLVAKEHFTGEVALEDFLTFIRNFRNQVDIVPTEDYERLH